MKKHWTLASSIAALTLAACSSVPDANPGLETARRDVQQASADPNVSRYAQGELEQARQALQRAEDSWKDKDDASRVSTAAHIASQRAQVAINLAAARAADKRVEQASVERERLRAEVRTQQAQVAQQTAQSAQAQAQFAQTQAQNAQATAAAEAERANRLQRELAELQAKPMPQGLVVMLQDVLFDTGKATLKEGAYARIDTLATVLKNHPERKILVEGFTDSVGSEESNLQLSRARAEAVRSALLSRGVPADRIDTRGNGEMRPVASNTNAAGRQQNRRVEIVFSDERGNFAQLR